MKKILFVTRFDASHKNGGDVNLLKTFCEELKTQFQTKLIEGVPETQDLVNVDYVVCTNLDRPLEAYATLLKCQKHKVKFVFYTLHHPYDGINAYLKYGVTGWRKIVASICNFNPALYEQFLWCIKFFCKL